MEYSYIAENIKRYRERANMTQQQLADKVGVSWEMISRYEREESLPYKKLDEISKALNVPKSQLLEKHVPDKYSSVDYKIPLFLHIPLSNKFTSSQTNYYYICPEWILKRDKECIAIDTSLIDSNEENFKMNGVIYVSKQIKPQRNDWVVVRENRRLIVKMYDENSKNILGKILAQEVRY
jgi:transcriptional regulator with XRE-family HTH domain